MSLAHLDRTIRILGMHKERFSKILIQCVRLLSLPFPIAILLSSILLEVADRAVRPDRSGISSGDPGEFIGGILMVIFSMILQCCIGLPSLLLLDRRGSGPRSYMALAAVVGLLLSAILALMFHAPQFGETFGWMFSRVIALIGPTILFGYLLAYWLRVRPNPKEVQQEAAPDSPS